METSQAGSDPDYEEKERVVHVEVRLQTFGSQVHVDRLRERLNDVLKMNFFEVEVTDVEVE